MKSFDDIQKSETQKITRKKSGEKTVEERIKTSRSLKIKNNKWNQVDYTEDFSTEKISIDPDYGYASSSYEDLEFENDYYNVINESKYRELLLGSSKISVSYQIVNEIILYCYARLKCDYSLVQIFVLTCEYCRINIQTMWKKLNVYLQIQILKELKEVSRLPKDELENTTKLF